MSKKEVKLKGVMDRHQVAAYLENLLIGLKAGEIKVEQGGQLVTLHPEQIINVEIEASVKKDKEKLEMELVWRKEEAPE
jgi:amphi-Trp domain-containing protein